MIRSGLQVICLSAVLAGWAYWIAAWFQTRRFLKRCRAFRRSEGQKQFAPSVSILKPIKGADAETYGNFISFCRQNYGEFEILFATIDPNDPAVPLVQRLQKEFPQVEIRLLFSTRLGANPKCANLHRLTEEARGEILVMCDADIRVEPDYLSRVVAPLADAKVGVVTCPYRGALAESLPARLELLHMDTVFLPAVLLAHRLGQRVGLGATLAMRSADLRAAGGIRPIADYLMDDYELVARIEALGLQTRVCEHVVASVLGRERFITQLQRELRWARGIRITEPTKYLGLLVTFPTAWAIGLLLARPALPGIVFFFATLALRWAIAWDIEQKLDGEGKRSLPWLPARDLLSFWEWWLAMAGRRITWRGETFILRSDGQLEEAPPRPEIGQWLTRPVRWIDRLLRRRQGIFEFCDDPRCILRASIITLNRDVHLPDGAVVAAGRRLCELHLFNEHLPQIGVDGAGMSWGKIAQRRLVESLAILAARFDDDPRFQDVVGLILRSSFVTHQGVRQLDRIGRRLAFIRIAPIQPDTWLQRLHDLGENLLLLGLLSVFNPGGLRRTKLLRERHHFYSARQTFLCRHGPLSENTIREANPKKAVAS